MRGNMCKICVYMPLFSCSNASPLISSFDEPEQLLLTVYLVLILAFSRSAISTVADTGNLLCMAKCRMAIGDDTVAGEIKATTESMITLGGAPKVRLQKGFQVAILAPPPKHDKNDFLVREAHWISSHRA